MITVNLKGGLGNQMFQYALGRHLALRNDDELKLDIDGLERANAIGDIYRPFTLGQFNILKNIATPEEIRAIKYPLGIFSKAWRYIAFKISRDKNTLFRPDVLDWKGDIYLDGYWQSPRYFEEIRDTLLKEFTLVSPLAGVAAELAAKVRATNSVSLHVRRGDYMKNPQVGKEFGICSVDYYTKAIAEIRNTVSDPTFFVFSDDVAWVKENLELGDSFVFAQGEGLSDTIELVLMSMCNHNIIANSSFSWWAAWLNQNPKKIVVAPTPWFDRVRYDDALLPPEWHTIPK
jgi:hypothetical protein